MKRLTILNPAIEILRRDSSGTLTGKMSDLFRSFMLLVYNLLRNSDDDTISLADDEEIELLNESSGYGICQIGDNQEYAAFTWASNGTVTLLTDVSANVVNTDTDGNLCIYDSGTQVKIKNRLGSTLNLRFTIKYNTL